MINLDGMSIKEMREACGLNRMEFARMTEIPWRTVQNWELGTRDCPAYVKKWIKRDLEEYLEGKDD